MKILVFLISIFILVSSCGDINIPQHGQIPYNDPDPSLKGIWAFLAKVNFDDEKTWGQLINAVGMTDQEIPKRYGNIFGLSSETYTMRSIKGDGSCWNRAMLQTVF